ncbi:MAG: hypothetical protein SFT94_09800 [Pseudanabaenaceae cyanobacterium bins.68]|nr:hypothetical protein [Pseudanabaenaceae cyanobacterium bins.68]
MTAQNHPELNEFAQLLGANQVFTDQGIITLLCPELDGKSLADLSPEEFGRLQAAALQAFPLIEIEDED